MASGNEAVGSSRTADRSARHDDLIGRASATIPGMTTNSLQLPVDLRMIASRGSGPYLYDVDDRCFLDWNMGGSALIFGHAYQPLNARLAASLDQGSHHVVLHACALELAERLCAIIPCAEMVRFASSGSEGLLTAVRLARAATGRRVVVKFEGAYHGHLDPLSISMDAHTEGDLPARPVAGSSGMAAPLLDEFRILRYNDADMVRRYMANHGRATAAILVEPFQRMLVPVDDFLPTLRETCDRYGTVLVFDEMLSGFHTWPGGAQAESGVVPDLAIFGKGLTAGHPQLAAIVGRRSLMELLDPARGREHVFHCGTYNGNALAVQAALFTLDEMERVNGYQRLREIGRETRERLQWVFRKRSVPCFMGGYGAFFHPYFTDRRVITSSDLRYVDEARSRAWHDALHDYGVFKGRQKGFLSLAHDEDALRRGMAAADRALRQVG